MKEDNLTKMLGQKRFSEAELALIQSAYGNNESVLKILRKVFMQGDLSKEDRESIVAVYGTNEPLQKVLRKFFLPDYDYDAPFGQTGKYHLWLGLQQLMQMAPQDREIVIDTQLTLCRVIENGLENIANIAKGNVPVSLGSIWKTLSEFDVMSPQDREKALLTQIRINNWVESCLMEIFGLSNPPKKETEEEKKERIKKDSVR
jgi:hypothetical protein